MISYSVTTYRRRLVASKKKRNQWTAIGVRFDTLDFDLADIKKIIKQNNETKYLSETTEPHTWKFKI